MQANEMIKQMAQRAQMGSNDEARGALESALITLADRLPREEAKDFAAQLPEPFDRCLELARPFNEIEKLSLQEFYQRIAQRQKCSLPRAKAMAHAATSVLADAVSAGQVAQVKHMLPGEYSVLFEATGASN